MNSKWVEKPLGDLIEYMARGNAPVYCDDPKNENAVMVLGQRTVREKGIDYSQARFHNAQCKEIREEKYSCIGDILINATGVGSAGRVAQVISKPLERCFTDSHVLTLRASSEIDPFYLGYFLKSKQKQIERFAEGSTGQTEMNKKRLATEIVVSFPENKAAQKAIACFGLIIDELISTKNQVNDYLAA